MKIRVMVDDQSFEVEVGDLQARPIPVVVDGEPFMIWPEELPQAGEPAQPAAPVKAEPANHGQNRASSGGSVPVPVVNTAVSTPASSAVTAPIPGVIISIAVKAGDTVSVGQDLCVLEAMKMKNNIRANRAGKVAAVRVAPGDQVKRGQVMLEFGD